MRAPLAAYVRERFRPVVFGPAIAGLSAAGVWASGTAPTAASLAFGIVLTTTLILQFRLWDDLEDRAADRIAHPDRVLSRESPVPFTRALALLVAVNIALVALARAWEALAGLMMLDAAFLLFYRVVRPRLSPNAWRLHLLPVKYPAFVVLVASALDGPIAIRAAMAAVVAYAGAYAYEALHDRPASVEAVR